LETTVEKVSNALASSGKHLSYDTPFSSDEDNTLLNVLQSAEPGTDKAMMKQSLSIEVSDSMRILDKKERDILELFFGLKNQHAHSLEGDRRYLSPDP